MERISRRYALRTITLGAVAIAFIPESVLAAKTNCKRVRNLEGLMGFYWRDGGCLGCRTDKKMKNGEALDDNRPTIALTPEEYSNRPSSRVLIKNLENGAVTKATVTDTGGFKDLGRIADGTLEVMRRLGVLKAQGLARVRITYLQCD